jgi:hypothetical protein
MNDQSYITLDLIYFRCNYVQLELCTNNFGGTKLSGKVSLRGTGEKRLNTTALDCWSRRYCSSYYIVIFPCCFQQMKSTFVTWYSDLLSYNGLIVFKQQTDYLNSVFRWLHFHTLCCFSVIVSISVKKTRGGGYKDPLVLPMVCCSRDRIYISALSVRLYTIVMRRVTVV